MRSLWLVFFLLAGSALQAKTLSIICYHRFGTETSKDPYRISLERLNGQLAWLKAEGYASVSLSQVARACEDGGKNMPEKGLMLSVDDGYRAGALGAGAFEAHGFKGVFFVNPGTLGKGSFMSWEDARGLEKDGHEVSSHTWSHENLAKPGKTESPIDYKARVDGELRRAKQRLEKELGHPVEALAYPYGAYNPAVSAAASAAGYKQHYNVSDGVNRGETLDALRIKRILIMGHPSLAAFQRRLNAVEPEGVDAVMLDASLFYQGDADIALTADGTLLSVGGKRRSALPADIGRGFHYLEFSAGTDRAKRLFQVAPAVWKPHFKALSEN